MASVITPIGKLFIVVSIGVLSLCWQGGSEAQQASVRFVNAKSPDARDGASGFRCQICEKVVQVAERSWKPKGEIMIRFIAEVIRERLLLFKLVTSISPPVTGILRVGLTPISV